MPWASHWTLQTERPDPLVPIVSNIQQVFPACLIFVLRLVSYKGVVWEFHLLCMKGA
jgi:hypothetical protein